MNTDKILLYEQGDLTPSEIVVMFNDLVETGDIWKLPTEYLEDATKLINLGHLPINKGTMQ